MKCPLLLPFLFPLIAQGTEVLWEPQSTSLTDPERYVSQHDLRTAADTETLLIQLDPLKLTSLAKIIVEVEPNSERISITAIDPKGKRFNPAVERGGRFQEVSAGEYEFVKFDGIFTELMAKAGEAPVKSLMVTFPKGERPTRIRVLPVPFTPPPVINLAPAILPPKGSLVDVKPSIMQEADGLRLVHPEFEAQIATKDRLRLKGVRHHLGASEIAPFGEETEFFAIEYQGQRIPAAEWKVETVSVEAGYASITLSHAPLTAVLGLAVEAEGLRLDLTVRSSEKTPWKALFPHISGLQISDRLENDYYFFPYYGGIIHTSNAHLRSLYGTRDAWWQMVSLYSPEKGVGVSLRVEDGSGIPKGIALRKGQTHPSYAKQITEIGHRVPKGFHWRDSLAPTRGVAFAVEYSTPLVAENGTAVYPPAIISFHQGDWRPALKTYADWAKNTWKWQEPRLQDRWNLRSLSMLRPVRRSSRGLYENGKWYSGYREDRVDIGEFLFWWKWSPVGPFGVDLNDAEQSAGAAFHKRFRYFFDQVDPTTGEPAYMVNDGDYDYNPSLGGLEGLRAGIREARESGALAQFYTCPFLVDSNTRLGSQYGQKYSVFNLDLPQLPPGVLPNAPRDGHYVAYGKWRMCLDAVGYHEMVIDRAATLAKETGVDIIRFDVMGTSGEVCLNPAHEHRFAKRGDLGVMRASRYVVEKVRAKAAEQGRPDLMISAEYPGADFLAATLNSVLTYETDKWTLEGLRPLPINFFRFAFPNVKYFDLVEWISDTPLYPAVPFFNGVGVFSKNYPPHLHQILHENSDVIGGMEVEPLVPTLVERIYANRFGKEGKEVVLFYNARNEKWDGPLYAAGEGKRYFDLLNGKELSPTDGAISIAMEQSGALLIVEPVATSEGSDSEMLITLKRELKEGTLVTHTEGKETRYPVNGDKLKIGATRGFAKLYEGATLIDAFDLNP